MMVAGEVSGDAHGAGLIRNMRKNHDCADIFGIDAGDWHRIILFDIFKYYPVGSADDESLCCGAV